MKKAEKQARQGDIFFKSVEKAPTKTVKPYGSNILAYGEVTGHAHAISSPSLSEYESVIDENGDIFVYSSEKDIEISHEEHGTITLEANKWWNVSRQREYDPIAVEKERIVAD